jgi:hypothetical protein
MLSQNMVLTGRVGSETRAVLGDEFAGGKVSDHSTLRAFREEAARKAQLFETRKDCSKTALMVPYRFMSRTHACPSYIRDSTHQKQAFANKISLPVA